MLIARLLADPEETHNSSEALLSAIDESGIGRDLRIRACDGFTQFELESDDMAAFCKLLGSHFPGTDALVAWDRITVPQVFVSDMDSTMIGQECIDELADFAGIKPQIAAITERAMQGELDFESALRERVMLLRDLSEGAILDCLNTRIEPMPGARVLVETLKAQGCRTVLVTGGFHQFADPVAEWLGFERVVGNRLAIANGSLTGELEGAITDSQVKRAVLMQEIADLGDDVTSMAAGDGANDIPMIEAATYGVAYRAKPRLRAVANGWVERGDLTALLRLLDIPESAWTGHD